MLIKYPILKLSNLNILSTKCLERKGNCNFLGKKKTKKKKKIADRFSSIKKKKKKRERDNLPFLEFGH